MEVATGTASPDSHQGSAGPQAGYPGWGAPLCRREPVTMPLEYRRRTVCEAGVVSPEGPADLGCHFGSASVSLFLARAYVLLLDFFSLF